MFNNTFSNDLTVQIWFCIAHYISLSRQNLSEFTGYHPSTLVADTNGVALGVTPRVLPLAFLPYSSSGDDNMKALCNKILSPNKMSADRLLRGLYHDMVVVHRAPVKRVFNNIGSACCFLWFR